MYLETNWVPPVAVEGFGEAYLALLAVIDCCVTGYERVEGDY